MDRLRLNRKDAATYLCLSRVTLARWATLKKGPPFVVVGNRAIYRVSDLDDYIGEQARRRSGC